MNAKSLIAAVCGMILKIVVAVGIIMLIYRGTILAYDYGYRVFEEPAMSAGEGRTVSVTITEDMSAKEMGQLFLTKGLIRDDRLFVLQYYLSEFRKELKTGDFELSTAMTVEEMMEAMTKEPVVEEPESDGMDNLPEGNDDGGQAGAQ
ncbi:MAG: endolytic transglycosylase MltG [bacterium]|nr:endolytic transglycosylase MltG [bacterium]MCM1375490.1 endolytic transglycosylase MltG [Muribaculum sp.]